jgi:cell wall-associated NlpC family hydrolase
MKKTGSVRMNMRKVAIVFCAFCIAGASCTPPLARTSKKNYPSYSRHASLVDSSPVSVSSNKKERRQSIIRTAVSLIGVPYRMGGSDPSGFDCSGFSSYVYKKNRIRIDRTASGQYRHGRKMKGKTARPGDLVFFRISGRGISHVGIYLGKGKFVHAPSTGKSVEVQSLNSGYWRSRFSGAATYL